MAMEHISEVLKRIPAILTGMYESPAEECLGERLRSMVDSTTKCQTQVWVDTWIGPFRLDLVLTDRNGRRIAVEVDGRDFHEPVRDHWRTVFVVGDKRVDVVYRVPARDLRVNLMGVLAGLASVEPLCFRQTEILRWKEITDDFSIRKFTNENDEDQPEGEDEDAGYGETCRRRWFMSTRAIENRFRFDAIDCEGEAIKTYYDFAVATGLKDLDAIQAAWKQAHPAISWSHEADDLADFSSIFE